MKPTVFKVPVHSLRRIETPYERQLGYHAHILTCGPRSWRTRLQGERTEG